MAPRPYDARIARPQILLVPSLTQFEWLIRPRLEEWADVATYDPPGVGDEPPASGPLLDAIAARGVSELEARDWTRCIVAGDANGEAAAIRLASLARDRVAGLALGHAVLAYRRDGANASLYPGVEAAIKRMMTVNYRSFVREEIGSWDPRRGPGAEKPPDELVERIVRHLPASTAIAIWDAFAREAQAAGDLEPILRELGLPLLLAKHEGCVSHTDEGFEEAVTAFPDAQVVRCSVRPSTSGEFADALRELSARVS